MSTKTLLLVRLARFPQEPEGDELHFEAGVNVLVGDKDAGKTVWLRMLDYLLGDDERPESALGPALAAKYTSVEADFLIGNESLKLRRAWDASAQRTKISVNEDVLGCSEFSEFLLEKLGIPSIRFPKGDPFAERAWPALSFRTILRHVYRQERFWSDFADKQSVSEQHACLALFLGVAKALFPPKYGELVTHQKRLSELKAKADGHSALLKQMAEGLVDDLAGPGLTELVLDQAERRITSELLTAEGQRNSILQDLRANVEAQSDVRTQEAKRRLDSLDNACSKLNAERQATRKRLSEIAAYGEMLGNEIRRFDRARAAGEALSPLRVTHCPVCDQRVESPKDETTCVLCHREYVRGNNGSSRIRVDFEIAQLNEEKDEIEALTGELSSSLDQLDRDLIITEAERRKIEHLVKSAQQFALSVLPPDITLIDQERGRLEEMLQVLHRLRRALKVQRDIERDIADLCGLVESLQSEIAADKAVVDLDEVSQIFERGMNEYLALINVGDSRRWTYGEVKVRIRERGFSIRAGEKPGATSQAIFLFAYHYALLSLISHENFYYPGLVVIDFPVQLADGASILDKENYLIEPFVRLCERPGFSQAQVIAAGHSFANLEKARRINIHRDKSLTPPEEESGEESPD